MGFEQARNGNDSFQITERMKLDALQGLPNAIRWNEAIFKSAFEDLPAYARDDAKISITAKTGDALAGLKKGIFG